MFISDLDEMRTFLLWVTVVVHGHCSGPRIAVVRCVCVCAQMLTFELNDL